MQRENYIFHCSRSLKWCDYVAPSSIVCVGVFTVLCYSCLGPDSQGRAGYPPVAPKPSVHMATGGAGPQEAGQGSPVVMKKMVPVQSSRPQPVAQQGEAQMGHHPLLVYLETVPEIIKTLQLSLIHI